MFFIIIAHLADNCFRTFSVPSELSGSANPRCASIMSTLTMSFSGLSVKHSASKDVGCTGASSKCDGSRINALIEKYVVNFLSRNSHKSFGKRLKELFSTLHVLWCELKSTLLDTH